MRTAGEPQSLAEHAGIEHGHATSGNKPQSAIRGSGGGTIAEPPRGPGRAVELVEGAVANRLVGSASPRAISSVWTRRIPAPSCPSHNEPSSSTIATVTSCAGNGRTRAASGTRRPAKRVSPACRRARWRRRGPRESRDTRRRQAVSRAVNANLTGLLDHGDLLVLEGQPRAALAIGVAGQKGDVTAVRQRRGGLAATPTLQPELGIVEPDATVSIRGDVGNLRDLGTRQRHDEARRRPPAATPALASHSVPRCRRASR